jgi:hypothetical protein
MEIDRVQLVKGLRVERTGSEQERRRRQQLEERFEDLLESTLEDEERQDQDARREKSAPAKQQDTVSISAANPALPLVNDLVSISTAGRVGAEVHTAGRTASDPHEIERVLRQQELPLAVEPAGERENGADDPADEAEEDSHVDTVA